MSDVNLREPTFEVAIGFKGVGKTYTLNKIIEQYIATLRRPVLVFDVNNEYNASAGLHDYKAIDFNVLEKDVFKRSEQIRNIKFPRKYKIIPIKKNGQPMTANELLVTATTVVGYFRNGMVVLEDINKYTLSHFKQEFVGTFIGLRHVGVDLVIHFQSLRAIPPKVWSDMEYLRWHKCSERIDKYKGRVTNFEIFSIGECIMDINYLKNNRYYFWINILKDKFINVSPEDFKEGCMAWLSRNPREFRNMLDELNDTGARKYTSKETAIKAYIERKAIQYL